jgi:signal transduction histidine kinase
MRWRLPKSNEPVLIIAVFAVGLLLAGGLLYRWINRASIADREQQEEFLNAAMRSFRGEFIASILEIRATFRPVPRATKTAALDEYLASFYTQWRSSDANGPLVSTFSVATIDDDGNVQYQTFDPKTAKFKQAQMPRPLSIFSPRVENVHTRGTGHALLYRVNGFPFAIDGSRPLIVVPLMEFNGQDQEFGAWHGPQATPSLTPPPRLFTERQEDTIERHHRGRRQFSVAPTSPPVPGRLRGWCFLGLDLNYLKQQFLPRLVERSFSKAGLSNYQVAVLAGDPAEIIYSSEAGLAPASFASPDAEAVLFASFRGPGLGFRDRAWEFFFRTEPSEQIGDSATATMHVPPREPDTLAGFPRNQFPKANAWVLAARNKAGSIDALVTRARQRNLALGFAVLLLLAFSMGSLVVTTHRARELARREVEFVAGVSHEFRTPLASIQSAGFNLASGVIRKLSRVQEYGELVQNEARRLTDMIEQVMSYAGIQSGGKRYELVPTQVPEIIERAIAEYGTTLRDAGWQVEKKFAENMPPVLAEAPAVEISVKNLLANAIKYAGAEKWLRITAAALSAGNPVEVQISVEDHGPGIDPADLPHIFEPFYRGQRVLASTVPGAGLGLSIVRRHIEAHGGRVSVESTKGKGSRFTLHLPALPEPERKAV